jgi:hypothetical protein
MKALKTRLKQNRGTQVMGREECPRLFDRIMLRYRRLNFLTVVLRF